MRMGAGAVQTKQTGRRSLAVAAKKQAILEAGLELFSQYGIHGTSIERVAERAEVSKTNLLYYYPSKEALYVAVLKQILDIWLAPLRAFREDLEPLVAIGEYIRLKLEVSRDFPQASRLFCLEMLQGAPLLKEELTGGLKTLVEDKSEIIAGWVASGKLANVDPHHLIFMLWATTQHYADFASQVEAVTGSNLSDEDFFRRTVENVQRMIIEGIRVR
jgi:AcrR family transcriptional regulator